MNVVTMALGIDVTYMITNILGHSFYFAYCKVKIKNWTVERPGLVFSHYKIWQCGKHNT